MIVGGNQNLDLNYKIKQSELEYSLSCTIGTATNSEHCHENHMILWKIVNVMPITGQTSQGNLDKMQILKNKLLKVLSCKNYRHPTNKLHNELSILKFEDMVKQETLSFMHNYVYGNLPKVFKNYFEQRRQLTDMKSEHRKRRFTPPKSNHDI